MIVSLIFIFSPQYIRSCFADFEIEILEIFTTKTWRNGGKKENDP